MTQRYKYCIIKYQLSIIFSNIRPGWCWYINTGTLLHYPIKYQLSFQILDLGGVEVHIILKTCFIILSNINYLLKKLLCVDGVEKYWQHFSLSYHRCISIIFSNIRSGWCWCKKTYTLLHYSIIGTLYINYLLKY